MRQHRHFCAAALSLSLVACATKPPSTVTYIERGQVELLQESVDIGSDDTGVITALLSVNGERKKISILSSACNDLVGSIMVPGEENGRENGQILAYGSGDRPADRLFAAVCDIRHRKKLEKQRGLKSGSTP